MLIGKYIESIHGKLTLKQIALILINADVRGNVKSSIPN